MADETTVTQAPGVEPPKANPLAKPAASSSTLTLKPLARPAAPTKPGIPTAGLKLPPKPGLPSGLKLPPKPGLATQSGLKLPPKPGLATQSGLKLPPKPGLPSGLKLPPKPGLGTQTGLKLPSKPVIRKPGSTLSMTRPPLPGIKKPAVTPVAPATQAATVAAPAAPATQAATVAAPVAPAAAAMTPVTKAEAEKPLEALKSATQNLKSITAPMPQQAILRKTGMLAEGQSEAQKQAAKSKTSRISLSEAMGAAPVLNENAPMKTIRIKRPIDIPTATKPAEPTTQAPGPDSAASTVVKETTSAEPATETAVTMTQRKTLKISRPSSGTMRPSGKFGIKRPGTMIASKTAVKTASKPEGEAAAKPAEGGDVPEIADIPSLPPAPVAVVPGEKDLPKGVSILGIIVQTAACVAMGALAWFLYTDTQILPF